MSNNNVGVAATIDCQTDSIVRSVQWALRRDQTSLASLQRTIGKSLSLHISSVQRRYGM